MEKEALIQDIPSIKKALDDIRALKTLKRAVPLARPILRLFGVDTTNMAEGLANIDDLASQFEELASLPDRFDDLFADRGWIIYDLMNIEVAKEAIRNAEAGDWDGAEADLVQYYDPETVKWQLRTMTGVKAFRPRTALAEKALADYREGRYHACVPVVLALLDGMVNDLHERQRGFFAEDADLQAWDSIAGHRKGLNALARIFRVTRRKTRTEQITVPYRHGIIHGRDLGYDNAIVAAKSWAALFATRDWALKAEADLVGPQPPEPQPGLGEILKKVQALNEHKARLKAWKARSIEVGEDIPRTGDPGIFENDTPEQKLAEFLTYWKQRNYGFMARCVAVLFLPDSERAPARVRQAYADKQLSEYELLELTDKAAALTEIETKLKFAERGAITERSHRFRMLCQDELGRPSTRGTPGNSWKVGNWEI